MHHYTPANPAYGAPAHNRRPVSWAQCLDLFTRGLDFETFTHAHTHAGPIRKFSIRDCAPGTIVQLRYGLCLQKTSSYTIPTHADAALARLQLIDNPTALQDPSQIKFQLMGFRPTRSQVLHWQSTNQISSDLATILANR